MARSPRFRIGATSFAVITVIGVTCASVAAGAGCVRRASLPPNYEPALSEKAGKPVFVRAGSAPAYTHFIRADLATREERWAEARVELRLALAYDPDSPYLEARLADVLLRLGRGREALKHANRSVSLGPDLPYGHLVKGFVLLRYRDYAAAARALESALRTDPASRDAFAMLAYAHRATGDRAALRTVYERMAAAYPEDWEPHARLAEMAIDDRDDARAADLLEAALSREPALPGAVRFVGAVREGAGESSRALALYDAALVEMPGMYDLRLRAIRMLLSDGRDAEALAHADALRAGLPSDERGFDWLVPLSRIFVQAGRWAAARPILEKLRSWPELDLDGEVAFRLGVTLAALGEGAAAIAAFAAVPGTSQLAADARARAAALEAAAAAGPPPPAARAPAADGVGAGGEAAP